jgi:hypothetical protein
MCGHHVNFGNMTGETTVGAVDKKVRQNFK